MHLSTLPALSKYRTQLSLQCFDFQQYGSGAKVRLGRRLSRFPLFAWLRVACSGVSSLSLVEISLSGTDCTGLLPRSAVSLVPQLWSNCRCCRLSLHLLVVSTSSKLSFRDLQQFSGWA